LNIEIVRYYLPRIEIALDIEVEAPHERVTQIVGLPVGKSSLSQLDPGKRSPAEEKRVGNKRDRLIEVVRKLAAGRSCLLVTHKDLEAAFGNIGSNIETAHFNAIEGIDRWRDVECLITIGRPLPAPRAVEEMAAALTGKPVLHPLAAPTRPGGRPQTMIEKDRGIRLKGGTEHLLACRVFELPEAELIRQAVTEAAVVQAVGRARGVNRTESDPVEIWMILSDTVVPIAIDIVAEFGSLEPGKIDIMIERGLVPAWSADAAKLYPDLLANAQSARKAYSRDGLDVQRNRRRSVTSPYKESAAAPGTPAERSVTSPYKYISIRECHTPLLRYQPKGLGQKPRLALIDPSNVAGARARIEAALGELISFEVITDVRQLELVRPSVARGLLSNWGKPGSNFAARLAADAERTFSRPLQGGRRLCWRVMATPAGMMASGP
jgi:putative DNA primase/helicase